MEVRNWGLAMATGATRHRWWKATPPDLPAVLAVGLTLAFALTVMLPAPTADAASGCSVKSKATGRTYPTLQRAVNAARPRQTLLVRGPCRGSTIVRKDLAIVGVKTKRWGVPRLTAYSRPVLVIGRGTRVTVRSLVILRGQGVLNQGMATLVDVQFKGSRGDYRPRVAIRNVGSMWLLGASSVRGAEGVVNRGRLVLSGDTRIRGNDQGVTNSGTLVMNGRSDIGNNSGCERLMCWEGPVVNEGRLVMNDRSSLSGGNGASNRGTMVMNDHSRIHHNSTGVGWDCGMGRGGGVRNTGRLVMRDHSAIVGNTLGRGDDCSGPDPTAGYAQGGGVYNTGSLIMLGQARINGNGPASTWTEVQGGGVYNARGGTLAGAHCDPGGNVFANSPDDCYFEE